MEGSCRTSFKCLAPGPAHTDETLQEYIGRQKASLEPVLNYFLSRCSSSLISLHISECSLVLTERCLWLASVHCPNLARCYYSSEEFPATPESVWALASGCTRLEELYIPPVPGSEMAARTNDPCLVHIASGFPVLTSLCVGGPGISLMGLKHIAAGLTHLKSLWIVRGPKLMASAVEKLCGCGLVCICCLYVMNTQISPQAVIKLLESKPSLQVLEVTVSFEDYFPNDQSALGDPQNMTRYKKIISNLQSVATHLQYRKVFTLRVLDATAMQD